MRLLATSVILVLTCLIIFLSHSRRAEPQREMGIKAHRAICIGVFACGCAARLLLLTSLPAGLSADEALLGVQAKALWQTGGFLFDGGLTTELPQWPGEGSGPLLAAITAPFVGVLGLSRLSVRLPLALLSCAAMAAAYALGRLLGGRRAGRWCLTVFALCPYFVLSARTAAGVQAAICLLPIALAMLSCGVKRPPLFYAGAAVMALLAYAQELYMLISPAAIVVCAAAACGLKKRHALGAAALGLAICVPAMATVWASQGEGRAFELFGRIQIPALAELNWKNSFAASLAGEPYALAHVYDKLWAVCESGFLQVMTHSRVASAMYAPECLLALYTISVPLMLLGALGIATRRLRGLRAREECRAARMAVIAVCAVTYTVLVFFGDGGVLIPAGAPEYFDYTTLLPFAALLMAAGLCSVERRSARGGMAMLCLTAASFALLGVHLLGGSFAGNASMYLEGIAEASHRAAQIQRQTGAVVNVSCPPFHFASPAEGTEMLYLFGADMDTEQAVQGRGTAYRRFDPYEDEADDAQIYILCCDDEHEFPTERFDRTQFGDYVLLTPREAGH